MAPDTSETSLLLNNEKDHPEQQAIERFVEFYRGDVEAIARRLAETFHISRADAKDAIKKYFESKAKEIAAETIPRENLEAQLVMYNIRKIIAREAELAGTSDSAAQEVPVDMDELQALMKLWAKQSNGDVKTMANRLAASLSIPRITAYQIVKRYFSIPGASGPAKRNFKSAGKGKKGEFNDCHDHMGQFCSGGPAPDPQTGVDDFTFKGGNAFKATGTTDRLAVMHAAGFASALRVNGLDDLSVEPITSFPSVPDAAGVIVYNKGKEPVASIVPDSLGNAKVVPLSINRQQFSILKDVAQKYFGKSSFKVEINDCCRDSENGQFCDCASGGGGSGGGGRSSTKQAGPSSKTLPQGRIGGGTGKNSAWSPVPDDRRLKMFEPLELSAKPNDYHNTMAAEVLREFPQAKMTQAQAAEKIREASVLSYQAITPADNLTKALVKASPEDATVEARVKGPVSAVAKTIRKPSEYPDVHSLKDMIGTRVIVPSGADAVANQNKVADTLPDSIRSSFNVTEDKRFLDEPRPDGYRAVHLEIQDKQTGLYAEVQIKTPNQDKWATWSHKNLYKMEELPEGMFYAKSVIKANKDEANNYAKAVSDYYYNLDTGGRGGSSSKPPCPDFIKRTVGCLD